MRRKLALALLLVSSLMVGCSSDSNKKGVNPFPEGQSGNGSTQGAVDVKPGTQEDLVVNIGDRVFFAFDSAVLSPEGQDVLTRQAQWLKTYPNLTVTIEGHCDERGTREYNLALGERRAVSVRKFLTGSGVPAERVSVISYGKERPVALGSNEDAWKQNRRGVTVVN